LAPAVEDEPTTPMKTAVPLDKEHPVEVRIGHLRLQGILGLPLRPAGVVLFAHGSGSGRLSPRNTLVARTLQQGGFATLLLDLLEEEEEAEDRRKVFDIDLLADRLLGAREWLGKEPRTRGLHVGYFGASTGAGAALQAAARKPEAVAAVVSRGGRPDLAAPFLPRVTAPTLLIVGELDTPVIEMNEEAYQQLPCAKELVIVPGASHLFEEPGTLEQVAGLALDWFQRHMPNSA
jgi:putative phosphoribosyl transferase